MLIVLASVNGAPGTTTAATLIGASWPDRRRVVVADCDPNGGDLAIRFGLATSPGWSALSAAARRETGVPALDPFLQTLSGGLEVLVGVRRLDNSPGDVTARSNVAQALVVAAHSYDIIVDAGRLLPGFAGVQELVSAADTVLIVTRRDSASVALLEERSESIGAAISGQPGLIVIGGGSRRPREIERITGIPLLGVIPFDPAAAAVVAGESGSVRRLERSPVVAASRRIARSLADGPIRRSVMPEDDGTGIPGAGAADEATEHESVTSRDRDDDAGPRGPAEQTVTGNAVRRSSDHRAAPVGVPSVPGPTAVDLAPEDAGSTTNGLVRVIP